MEYVTVFQISRQSLRSHWLFVGAGLLPLIVGAVLIAGKVRFGWRRPSWLAAGFLCIFSLVWFYSASIDVFKKDSGALAAFETRDYSQVEGVVTDFHPMPYEGRGGECFIVQSHRFCYSDYVLTPGFHNSASHGGPIRGGIHVRIAYSGSDILRLDIAKNEVPTPEDRKAVVDAAERQWGARVQNDPIQQRLTTAFAFTAVVLTLLWTIQWKRSMGLWIRPPYRPATEYVFRALFGLSLIFAITGLIRQLCVHPLTRQNAGPTLAIAAIMFTLVGSMKLFSGG